VEPPEFEEYGVELHARDGRVVLIGRNGELEREVAPEEVALPSGLATSLDEWAQVVEAVLKAGQPKDGAHGGDLVSRRGRQLAARLAGVLNTEVGYADPVRGRVEVVSATPAQAGREPGGAGRRPPSSPPPPPRPVPAEKTPWGTGLTVSGFVAVFVTLAVVALSRGLGETSRWLALVANVLLVVGLLPSVWLVRRTPVWRWMALGVVAGLAAAWFALLLTLL
jgi:hypothetical protein